jgi:hypothetical protein
VDFGTDYARSNAIKTINKKNFRMVRFVESKPLEAATRKEGVILCTTVMLPESLSMCDISRSCFAGQQRVCAWNRIGSQVVYGDNYRETHV